MAEPFQKNGTWYARVKDAGGRWRNVALPEAKTKAAARVYAVELAVHKRRQRDGLAAMPTDPSLTVAALLRWWLDTYVAGHTWASKEEHRKGELFWLRKRDIDLGRRLIMVRRTYDSETTKGGREKPSRSRAA